MIDPFTYVPPVQMPVAREFDRYLDSALVRACALRDNAQDRCMPLSPALVADWKVQLTRIQFILSEAELRNA